MSGQQQAQESRIGEKLHRLAELYESGQNSELVDRTLDKLLAYEVHQAQTQLSELQSDLRAFEVQYGLSSAEFYERFQAGQLDDRMDYVEWASLVQMVGNLRQRLQLLQGQDAA